MKKLIIISIGFLFSLPGFSQDKYFSRNTHISFHSSTPMEDIDATNTAATCVMDATTGNIEFSALMKSFQFPKALMQEHFNENYVESEKFPKATFKGTILNMSEIDLSRNGIYPTKVKGMLTLHGVTQELETDGKLEVKSDGITATSSFDVKPEDFDIGIPAIVRDKIQEKINVVVEAELKPLKK